MAKSICVNCHRVLRSKENVCPVCYCEMKPYIEPKKEKVKEPSSPPLGKWNSERALFERYCIACDSALVFDGLKFNCPNCRISRYTETPSRL